jgi:N-acetylmuramoyl-L-alanine amidase
MYKTVEEKSVQKTDEKLICKILPRYVLFLIPAVLVVMLFGAIMGAIAGLKSRPEMLEGEVVKLETIDDRVTQITEIKKNKLAMVDAISKKVDSEVKKKNPENVSTESCKINDEILFKVQILISKTPLKSNSPWFKGVKNVWEYTDSSLYKYTVGNKRDIQSASALQSELRKKGFSDAFVVAFQNGKRIPLRKALRFSS